MKYLIGDRGCNMLQLITYKALKKGTSLGDLVMRLLNLVILVLAGAEPPQNLPRLR